MEVSSIAEQLYFTSLRVETIDASDNKGIATSFIFDYKSENKQYPFLITNKHVVSGTERGRLTFIQARNGKPLLGTGFTLDIEHVQRWEDRIQSRLLKCGQSP